VQKICWKSREGKKKKGKFPGRNRGGGTRRRRNRFGLKLGSQEWQRGRRGLPTNKAEGKSWKKRKNVQQRKEFKRDLRGWDKKRRVDVLEKKNV